jgi:hypothetical protein
MPSRDNRSFLLDSLALEIYETLARRFPVCLASDEFHYFPHYRSPDRDWSAWDDLSFESVKDIISLISTWISQLEDLSLDEINGGDMEENCLCRLLTTLKEQLDWVRFQETQPTFYLTIVGIGLTEAFEAGIEEFKSRVIGLPKFLGQALKNINKPSGLSRDQGLEMSQRISKWLASLPKHFLDNLRAGDALENFMRGIESMETESTFHPPLDQYAHIARYHMDCRVPLDEVEDHLKEEIEETEILLNQAAGDIKPGVSWRKVISDLEDRDENHGDIFSAYREVVEDLYQHCDERGFFHSDFTCGSRVRVEEVPEYMRPVRSNAAFSMPPGHPPGNGVFYVLPISSNSGIPADYRLLSAHETYPGHQLLDTSRWLLPNVIMRSIEFPIFYEGWASFSEEILFDTGFFAGPVDHLLMAKRRYWRAQRGLIDLRINTGRWDLHRAAEYLTIKGLAPAISMDMVRRYALKPGYQLAYTLGRRRFQELYTRYRASGGSINSFVRNVMSCGEIGFDYLAKLLDLKEEKH